MLKIVLSGRGLALTVQLFGRAAGGCGLCAETLALLALGILALEESLAGGLVRLGRGEGIYGNGACFLRFVVVEIDLDLTVLELSARKSDIDLLTVNDALLVVLCAVDGDKLPLIASIKPDGKGHYEMDTVETNLVLTIFGKDNYMNYFQGALTPDKIVYIDKKQGQKLERLAERQLFGNYSSLDPNCIIHQPQCIYKLKEMEIVDRARSLTNKVLETRDSCESLASQRNVVEHESHEERI